ncbi:TetR/AcrR family transcriptional regulator [Streptomyces sp. NPDC059002]|uniref:TetR/AcrR family transcriptional regulator n=1 Tax=Streptomyces sp. NPDC059002 TaxID=3346690 RepID=UPI003681B54F
MSPTESVPEPAASPDRKKRRVRFTSQQRRASILEAATEVFARTGYQRGKVSVIAARVGVSEPVVFQNFGSKSALYRAVLDHAVSHLCELLESTARSGRPVDELLADFLAPAHQERLHARGSLGFLFADAHTLTGDPELAEAVRALHERFADHLTALLAQGQREGDIRPDLDPRTGAWWLLSTLHARTFRSTVAPQRAPLEAELVKLTLEALTGRAEPACPAPASCPGRCCRSRTAPSCPRSGR